MARGSDWTESLVMRDRFYAPCIGEDDAGTTVLPDNTKTDSYTDFVTEVESKLRHALTAAFGPEHGREAVAEALLYGWEHWSRIEQMENPAGYVYRVAYNYGKRATKRRQVAYPQAPLERLPWVEPELPTAFGRLSERQRIAVYLVFGHEWSMTEVAELLDLSKSTVQNHVERGMRKLRRWLGVEL